MRGLFILLLLATFLSACQTPSYVGDENSPFYTVPAGSRLALNREITIPRNQVSVYLQNGRVVSSSEIQRYYPFCKFELYSMSGEERTVTPDEIVVVRSGRQAMDGGFASAGQVRPVKVRMTLAQMGDGGGPPLQSYITQMDLRSEKQPDIFRATCGTWGYIPQIQHTSVNEIRKALGDVFTLRLPQ